MRTEILTAQQALRAIEREIAVKIAEAIITIESADAALDADDRSEATRLIDAAADIEYDLTGDCEACAACSQSLGLEEP